MLPQTRLLCQSLAEPIQDKFRKPMETLDKPAPNPASKSGAKRNPEAKKQRLIDATLDTIAENGITDTSVSRIIERAGLSRGMIHLHFGGKDKLLAAAAKKFSEEYYAEMDRLGDLGDQATPEAQVIAIVRADLSPVLLNPRSTKIWHAFRGVASTHSGIARYSSTQDQRLVDNLQNAFQKLTTDPALAKDATRGTLALLEGMWVSYLTEMDRFSRDQAEQLICRFLSGLFPGRF